MDLEKAGRCLPHTITATPFCTLGSRYEFLINAHDVAKYTRVSCTKGVIAAILEEDVDLHQENLKVFILHQ